MRAESQLQLQLLRASHDSALAHAHTTATSATRRIAELQSQLEQAQAELVALRSGEATASMESSSLQARYEVRHSLKY